MADNKTTPVADVKAPTDTTDYAALFQDKRNQFVAKYGGKPGMNPFLYLKKFAEIENAIFVKPRPLTEAEKLLVKSEWAEPKV